MLRRILLPVTGVLALTLATAAVTGCSSADEFTGAAPAAGATATSAPPATPAAAAFPVSITHAFGTATIPAEPMRVVALGYQELDPILALGKIPVGARYWFGDENDVVYPWAEAAAGGADIEILNMPDGISVEKVAALRPDLILGIYSDLDQSSYNKLAKIAPTVGRPAEYIDYGTPWQVQTEMIGRALGRSEQAGALIAGIEQRFADFRTQNPDLAGKEAVVTTYSAEGMLGTFASQDPRARFFADLGFVTPAEIDERAGSDFFVSTSKEKASLVDADLLVWDQLSYLEGGRDTIENDPVLQRLQAMQDGRALFLDDDVEFAFAYNTVLSLPFALDGLLPKITAALRGGSTTATPTPAS
ncbi:MAG: iron-siderophore ABC transporter substrate-binding protein [Sporichthyaceae bacterium]